MDLTSFTPSSALLTVLLVALAPFVAVMLTSFTKIVVVLSLLRNALGVQQVPPNLVLNGLAMILTVYVMYPVSVQVMDAIGGENISIQSSDEILELANNGKEPVREFLLKHSSDVERSFFQATISKMLQKSKEDTDGTSSSGSRGGFEEVSSSDFIVLIPAFTISELTAAFQIGFLIYLPFIVIDLVVSNILMALGMMMLSPTVVSLPFKLLLFVVVDGWAKLSHGLVLSYL